MAKSQAENKSTSAVTDAAAAAATSSDEPPPLPTTQPPPLEDEYEEVEYIKSAQKATFSIKFGNGYERTSS